MIVTSYFMYLIKVTYQLREASRDTEIGDSNRWRSVTLGHNRGSTAPGQSHCLPARCVTLRNNSKSSGSGIFQMTPPEGTEELSSPKARLDAEGSSDEWERLSRSPAGSGCSTGSPMVDVTLTAWNDQGSDSGLELNALSPALVYSRSPFTMELPSSSQQPSPELISSVSNMSTSSSNGALSAVVRSKHSFVESYMYYKKHFTFSQALFILID